MSTSTTIFLLTVMDDRTQVLSNISNFNYHDGKELGSVTHLQDCAAHRCYIGFSVIMFVIAAVVIILTCLSTTGTPQKQVFTTKCPPGTYPCESDGACFNTSLMCDDVPDCKDGSDEGIICDKDMNNIWTNWFRKPHDFNTTNRSTDCILENVPDVCQCLEMSKLVCVNQTLITVPPQLPSRTSVLELSLNKITHLTMEQFRSLHELEILFIDHSYVTSVSPETFRDTGKLRNVHLRFNKLTHFSTEVFTVSNVVQEISLEGNLLTELKRGDFINMSMLTRIELSKNKIYSIQDGAFQNVPSLELLDLRDNLLREIHPHFFTSMTSLRNLYLSENRITRLHPFSFISLASLESLDLAVNIIPSLNNQVFDGLHNLTILMMACNKISRIEKKAFSPLVSLKSLDLRSNNLRTLENGTFSSMQDLSFIYFDKFYMCLYVPQARLCQPQGDGISSKENLLENIILRICVWVVALLACGGNLMVILGRFMMREDNQIHSFFIKNLSLADLLMGVYLLIIAFHDIKFRGRYIVYDEIWRNSWECDLSGLLSTLSTEMSVLTLSVITLDRYINIMYPLSFRKRGLGLAYCVMITLWLVCIMLAALPIIGIDYFGSGFYSDNAVCVPLYLHEPRAKGWEYSSFLFLGINFGSFGFIAYAYIAMFYAIHMSALPLRTSRESKERSLVKRFFFIVITDFMCWIPVIIIKIMALGGTSISGDLYAWMVVFALPVNSALNPLLYTLTTNMFKKKLLSKFTVVFRTESSQSRSSIKNTTSLTRQVQECEMDLLKRYNQHSTRSAIVPYLVQQSSARCPLHPHGNDVAHTSGNLGVKPLTSDIQV